MRTTTPTHAPPPGDAPAPRSDDSPGLPRRTVLAGVLSAYTASLIPWALAQPFAHADRGPFDALSALLAGQSALNTAQAAYLFDALVADDPGFPAATRALLALVNERQIDPLQLQAVLDDEQSPLASVPTRIASAWFLGIVGSGAKARCIAFEHALNAQIVADVLKPPTYAYGPYGSWSRQPA